MKGKINNETRAKFFAQYWDQRIGVGLNEQVDVVGCNFKAQSAFTETILLKPLSSISDEDANELYKILYPKDNYATEYQIKEAISWLQDEFGISTIKHKWDCVHASDYLRSKGYALPYFGLSVEEMVEAGWIKLTK